MKPPPCPYTMGYSGNGGSNGHRYMVIYDAKGRVILSVFGKQEERLALAEMIIEASTKAHTSTAHAEVGNE